MLIKLGETGWADRVDALGVKYDGAGGCWLFSSLETDVHHMLLQAKCGHAAAWNRTFSPFKGQRGLLFSGGHKPEKYGMKASVAYGGIYFVRDDNPEKYHNYERDAPLSIKKGD